MMKKLAMGFHSRDTLLEMGFGKVGDEVQVSTKASIYGASHISLGDRCRIDDFCVISAGDGGVFVGQNVHVAVMCALIGKGRIDLHDFSGLSSRVTIYSSSDDYSGEFLTNPTVPDEFKNVDHRDVSIGRHAIIGCGSVILPGVTIGEGAAVGALSLVVRSLDAFGMYVGCPARRIKNRSRALLALEKQYLASRR